jgi:hypothetical protein
LLPGKCHHRDSRGEPDLYCPGFKENQDLLTRTDHARVCVSKNPAEPNFLASTLRHTKKRGYYLLKACNFAHHAVNKIRKYAIPVSCKKGKLYPLMVVASPMALSRRI